MLTLFLCVFNIKPRNKASTRNFVLLQKSNSNYDKVIIAAVTIYIGINT